MRKKLFSGLLVTLFVLAAGGASTPRTEAADLRQRRSPPTPAQLKDLHTRTLGLFENPQVVFTDVDEQTNRFTVGVEQAGAAAAVRQRLPSLGVPTDLMDVVVTPPIVQMATLRDRVRPLVGGLQIHFGKFLCTLGFNGVRAGVNGFVENSHCTDKQGGVENTKYYQPLAANFIGTETADPVYTGSKCPPNLRGKVCRYSDSAYAQRDVAVSADRGIIARPVSVNTGSLTIGGSFRVVGEGASLQNGTVNKVGRTTGWTQGTVSKTCAHTAVSGTNIVELCQDWVSAPTVIVGGGDSSSPVFAITNFPDVQLRGILWGGTSDGKTWIHSPISNVQRSDELGPITNCALGFAC